jgi:hypothetical protein
VVVEAPTAGPAAEGRYGRLADELAAALREGRSADPRGPELPDSFEEGTVGGFAWLFGQLLSAGQPVDPAALLPELESIGVDPYVNKVV